MEALKDAPRSGPTASSSASRTRQWGRGRQWGGRRQLVGDRGANTGHKESHTCARIEIRGNEAEGWLDFVVSACDGERADKAEAKCDDLAACV